MKVEHTINLSEAVSERLTHGTRNSHLKSPRSIGFSNVYTCLRTGFSILSRLSARIMGSTMLNPDALACLSWGSDGTAPDLTEVDSAPASGSQHIVAIAASLACRGTGQAVRLFAICMWCRRSSWVERLFV